MRRPYARRGLAQSVVPTGVAAGGCGEPRGGSGESPDPQPCGCLQARGMTESPLRVVIAGGGVAALETLLALRVLAGRRTDITLVAPERDFILRPATVGEPFDLAEARRMALADIAADQDAELVHATLARVDVPRHVIETREGDRVAYDVLVVATGAVATEPLAGAVTFTGRPDVSAVRSILEDL